jgi:hypothetical protein
MSTPSGVDPAPPSSGTSGRHGRCCPSWLAGCWRDPERRRTVARTSGRRWNHRIGVFRASRRDGAGRPRWRHRPSWTQTRPRDAPRGRPRRPGPHPRWPDTPASSPPDSTPTTRDPALDHRPDRPFTNNTAERAVRHVGMSGVLGRGSRHYMARVGVSPPSTRMSVPVTKVDRSLAR